MARGESPLGIGPAGFALSVLAMLFGEGRPVVAFAALATAQLAIAGGATAAYVFTFVVFRRDSALARAAVLAGALVFAVSFVGRLISDSFTLPVRLDFWTQISSFDVVACMLWGSFESLHYYARMRRRALLACVGNTHSAEPVKTLVLTQRGMIMSDRVSMLSSRRSAARVAALAAAFLVAAFAQRASAESSLAGWLMHLQRTPTTSAHATTPVRAVTHGERVSALLLVLALSAGLGFAGYFEFPELSFGRRLFHGAIGGMTGAALAWIGIAVGLRLRRQ